MSTSVAVIGCGYWGRNLVRVFRQRVTKGAGNRTKALTMAFKLLEMAEQRWRRLDGSHLLPLVRAGVKFVGGVQVERPNEEDDRKEAA